MSKRLRGAIAQAAADLLYRQEAEGLGRAKRRAAREMGLRFRPRDLPSNREVHARYEALAAALAGDGALPSARAAALAALAWQRRWRDWRPLVVHPPDDPRRREVRLAAADRDAVLALARRERIDYRLDAAAEPWRAELLGAAPVLALLYADAVAAPPAPRVLLDEAAHAALLAAAAPAGNLEDELLGLGAEPDRFAALASALAALEDSDGLAPGLAAFAELRASAPHDEELLTAALLHGFEPDEDGATIGAALAELLTDRTRWLLAAAAAENLAPRNCPTPADWDDALALRAAAARAAAAPGGLSLDEALADLRRLDRGEGNADEG